MRPFAYARAGSAQAAIENHLAAKAAAATPSVHAPSQYIAGGTTMTDLMKLDVMRPERLTDINPLAQTPSGDIEFGPRGLWLGALVRMAEAADHPDVYNNYPVIAQSLQLAASQQIRNMASLGGNVLQRTRCSYFRDVSYPDCNKRAPGSGCAAMGGFNRPHAVLGTSDQCIAAYAGDFAQALIALDAKVEVATADDTRIVPFSDLHRPPGDTPHLETNLKPGELIMAFTVPPLPFAKRSLFLKVRDRESYEFALASAAVALDLDGENVREARIALGGVSALPWRAHEAEELLKNKNTRRRHLEPGGRRRLRAGQAAPAQRLQGRARQAHAGARLAPGCHDGDQVMNRAAPAPLANMGEPAPRIDGRLKVTGEALYCSDMPVRNPAYAFLVTSPIAKGRITSIDLAEAQAVRGVLDILTHETMPKLTHVPFGSGLGPNSSWQDMGPEIGHAGQIVGVVLADTFEAAREAAHKVKIDYAAKQPSATFGSPGVTREDAAKVNERAKDLPQAGDADKAFAAAEVTLDAHYGTPTQHHNAIELFTTTCQWNDGQLTVYEPSQFVYGLKNELAQKLDIAPDKVRVVSPFLGGAFGGKSQLGPRTGFIAYAAKKLNRPVKLVATRDQGFGIHTYRAETRHHIRIGARRDGTIRSFIHEGQEITSRPDAYKVAGVSDSARLYHYDTIKTSVALVHADRNTPGFMRSPPVVPYIYALESAIDELAIKLDMDPVELRRANDSMKDGTGKPWSSRSLMQCYDQAAKAFGWSKRTPKPGSMRDGDWLVGWGCASAVYPTHIGVSAARVRLNADGRAHVQVAAHDLGTGAYTVIAQMAAERLGLPLTAVEVELGDSNLPPATVAGGSNTTASVCSAVAKACDAVQAKLKQGGNKREDAFKKLGVGAIEEYAEFLPPGAGPEAMKKLYAGTPFLGGGSHGDKLMYALGAEFVEVRVHAQTREIRVPRIVGAFAAGHIMNPRTTRSQYMGGMIWGISSALHEATEIDERNARYVNDNLADYLLPVNADIQELEVILVPENDDFVNPIGVKGVGELGNVGTAAAIANAVHHATGVRVRELPIRLEKLMVS